MHTVFQSPVARINCVAIIWVLGEIDRWNNWPIDIQEYDIMFFRHDESLSISYVCIVWSDIREVSENDQDLEFCPWTFLQSLLLFRHSLKIRLSFLTPDWICFYYCYSVKSCRVVWDSSSLSGSSICVNTILPHDWHLFPLILLQQFLHFSGVVTCSIMLFAPHQFG